ncbi:hypothetical protein BGW38_002308 [Lunasporangiospora selenospora]|uniref:MICOS complex subunit n=1 Tax=Lunasporangiospora selenospora TaxID=979761 RepID=A0A9P6G5A0_9FUNG|nr:hypothetical protein BGW38_002308 [Lunasporangiospora selenospora]
MSRRSTFLRIAMQASERGSKSSANSQPDNEPLFPGLAYAGAAAIAGAVLVNGSRSSAIKVLTPLAVGAAAGTYFLPAHTDVLMRRWNVPLQVKANETNDQISSLTQQAKEAVDDVSRQAKADWADIKGKVDDLANDYRLVGQDKVDAVTAKFDNSVQNTKSWLGQKQQQAEAGEKFHNRFHDLENTSANARESAFYREQQQGKPTETTSRWSWWSNSDSVSPAKELETKIAESSVAMSNYNNVERPIAPTETEPKSEKPRKIVVDKTVAKAAIKGYEDTINRGSIARKNTEDTARKAAESDLRDGQYVIREVKDHEEPVERVIKMGIKKDLHHGLENLERRAHMLYTGVEHLEYKINKNIQKALEEEADFWHQESLKDQANARGGERGV